MVDTQNSGPGVGAKGGQATRARAYAAHAAAAKLLPGTRLAKCHRVPWQATVGVQHSAARDRASYIGLTTCGSVSACPICARKVAERRRQELEAALAEAQRRGYQLLFLTMTVRHHKGDSCGQVLQWLTDARRRFRSGREWQSLKAVGPLLGYVSTLEVTVGENGWHPHCHEVWVLREPLDSEHLSLLTLRLVTHWQNAVVASGGDVQRSYGLRLEVVGEHEDAVADYLLKGGQWGVCDEMTKAHTKHARRAGRTVASLLDDYMAGDEESGRLYVEYVKALRGRRVHRWSSGLRRLLGLMPEQEDAEVAAQPDEVAVTLAYLDLPEWRELRARGLVTALLDVADYGSMAAVHAWLEMQGIWAVGRSEAEAGMAEAVSGEQADGQPKRNATKGSQVARSGVEWPGREAQTAEVIPDGEARTHGRGDAGGDGADRGAPSSNDDAGRGHGVWHPGFRGVAGDGREPAADGLQHRGHLQVAGRLPLGRGPGRTGGRRGGRGDGPGGPNSPAA